MRRNGARSLPPQTVHVDRCTSGLITANPPIYGHCRLAVRFGSENREIAAMHKRGLDRYRNMVKHALAGCRFDPIAFAASPRSATPESRPRDSAATNHRGAA